jgi:hypothetical protein
VMTAEGRPMDATTGRRREQALPAGAQRRDPKGWRARAAPQPRRSTQATSKKEVSSGGGGAAGLTMAQWTPRAAPRWGKAPQGSPGRPARGAKPACDESFRDHDGGGPAVTTSIARVVECATSPGGPLPDVSASSLWAMYEDGDPRAVRRGTVSGCMGGRVGGRPRSARVASGGM